MKKEKSLSSLCPGQTGVVRRLSCEGEMRRRFMEIGLIPGTKIVCMGRSPLGDPSLYLIRGKLIAIRKEDAKEIVI